MNNQIICSIVQFGASCVSGFSLLLKDEYVLVVLDVILWRKKKKTEQISSQNSINTSVLRGWNSDCIHEECVNQVC